MPDGIRIVEAVPESSTPRTAERTAKVIIVGWRVVTWPVRAVAGVVASLLLRLYLFYFVQANSKAKCPACGVRAEHDVRWSDAAAHLVHVCKRCLAVWAEEPCVQYSRWRTTLQADVDGGDVVAQDGTRTTTVQHAQREPQISYVPTGKDKPIVLRMGGQA